MDFRLLGPLVARADDGSDIPLGGPKQRAVLGLLLANAGRVVDTDHIVEELWPESPDEPSRKTAQAYVSRLRGQLGEHGAADAIQARPKGYLLRAAGIRIDAREFEHVLANARVILATDPAEAGRLLTKALRLWRGRPFEDAYPTAELEREAARLEEQRRAAMEVWAEAELAAGRHREIIGELRRVTQDNPLDEHPWALLMLALYRSGRQGEALGMYVEVARVLSEELGVEPGSELADLQRRMLHQDPSLELLPSAPAPCPAGSRQRLGRRRIFAAAIVMTLVAIISVAFFLRPWDAERTAPRPAARFAVPQGAIEIVAAGARVWVMDPTVAILTSVNDQGATARYELPAVPSAITAGMGYLWIASEESGLLAKIDPATGRTLSTVDGLDLTGAALAAGSDAVWVIREHVIPFLRVDPDNLGVEPQWFRDGFGGPAGPRVSASDGRLWASNAYIGRVMSLDPTRPESEDFAGDPRIAEHAARSILSDHESVWFSQPTNGSVTRIDATTGEVSAIVLVGRTRASGFGRVVAPYALAAGPGGIWVALPDDGKVVLLDDDSGAVLAELGFERPTSITASVGGVWVLDEGANELIQVMPETCTRLPFIGPGADLRGCDLSGAVLVGVDLTGADLRWAELHLAAAQRANFTDADLFGADLSSAALDNTTWGGTRCPDGTFSEQRGGTCAGVRRP